MPIDPSIIAGLKPPSFITPVDALGVQNALYRQQLAQMQMGEMQSKISGRNALAQMLSQGQGVDPTSGLPSVDPNQMRQLLAQHPQAGPELLNFLGVQQKLAQERSAAELNRAKLLVERQKAQENTRKDIGTAMLPIDTGAESIYRKKISSGMDDAKATSETNEWRRNMLNRAVKSGALGEQTARQILSQPWSPDNSSAMIAQYRSWTGKPYTGPFTRLNPKDYTSESLKKYEQSGDVSDLVATKKDTRATQEWSDPYPLQGAMVQRNLSTGEIRTSVSREPQIRVESPVQTHTDEEGKLWERKRGGQWEPAFGPGGKQLGSKVLRNPEAEQLFHDYDKDPMVRQTSALEVKMNPLVDYMITMTPPTPNNPNPRYTGKSVNANDAALAKAYLAVTTSYGNRAYTMDKKELAKLPNLGDRLGNIASSFFAGKDLTDTTRKEMFNYIVSSYKSGDAERQRVRAQTIARGKARGISEQQIFGAAQ